MDPAVDFKGNISGLELEVQLDETIKERVTTLILTLRIFGQLIQCYIFPMLTLE